MNIPVPQQAFTGRLPPGTTQGAQNFARYAWTLEMFERAIELGLFGEFNRLELIHGELVPKIEDDWLPVGEGGRLVNAKGVKHETVRNAILNFWFRRLPDDLSIASEPGWRPKPDVYLEPDILIFDAACSYPDIPVSAVRLLVEVAHSSLKTDLGLRASIAAGLGVHEYWVIDAASLTVHCFGGPVDGAYTDVTKHGPSKTVIPSRAPALAVRMGDIVRQPKNDSDAG